MSTNMHPKLLLWRIRYDGADPEILDTLDAADEVARGIARAAGQRACAMAKGSKRPVERLTKRIDRLYLEWLGHMRQAHRLVKSAKMWGDPTVPIESLYEPTDSDGDEAA
jgi:hypothetical protein